MAFCPECGKPATADAARCVHCGHELGAREKKVGGGRFKGTMMMAPPVGAQPAEPANANAPVVVTKPPPALIAQPGAPAAAPVAKNHAAKATMIGPGIAPLIAAAAAAKSAAPAAVASKPATTAAAKHTVIGAAVAARPAAAPEPRQHIGLADPRESQPQAAQRAQSAAVQQAAPKPDAFSNPEAQRYLPGDPMSPAAREKSASRAKRLHDSGPQPMSAKASTPRLTLDEDGPISAPVKDRKLIYLGIGMVVLMVVLALVMLR